MAAATNVSAVWLEVLRAGRPVKYADVASALPELSHNNRSTSLNVAYRMGYLERSGEPRDYEYNITPRCNVPPGITILEVLEGTA